jgi:hypothetical protein
MILNQFAEACDNKDNLETELQIWPIKLEFM